MDHHRLRLCPVVGGWETNRAPACMQQGVRPMAPILPYLKDDSVFDPEATQAMSAAFDATCNALGVPDANSREREVIATRIIELARRGERNADRLRDRVIHEAGSLAGVPAEAVRRARA